MRHEMLPQRALFVLSHDSACRLHYKKGHAETSFRDACRTSSYCTLLLPNKEQSWGCGSSIFKLSCKDSAKRCTCTVQLY